VFIIDKDVAGIEKLYRNAFTRVKGCVDDNRLWGAPMVLPGSSHSGGIMVSNRTTRYQKELREFVGEDLIF
jgi:hypothetical protein